MSARNLAATRPTGLPEAGDVPVVTPWVRNPSWLALTPVGDTDQMFRGLLAVFPDSTFTAFTAAGDYEVDWGDGSTTNYSSGATALKQYDFNDPDLDGTNAPVTLTDAGDLVERTAHGYTDGMEVRFYNIATTTGLTAGQVYYVINATANSFQVAATVGGSAIALTGDGSATLLPYKQVIVTVTPQAGQNLTALNLNVRHTQTGLQAYETGWLDIEVGSPNFTSAGLTIAGTADFGSVVAFSMCERVAVRNFGGVNDLNGRFRVMRALQSVTLANTSAVTNMDGLFGNCSGLQTVPPFDTSSATNMQFMFNNCANLYAVPMFNTGSATNMASMFSGCRSIKTVPLFNTVNVTNMSSMFLNCSSLVSVPLFDTGAVTNMSGMFSGCTALQSVPLLNTAAVTNMSNMFNGCSSLRSIPLFNTASVINMALMFNGCTSLLSVPPFNTPSLAGTIQGMFANCLSLKNVPLFNTAAVTNMNSMFSGCSGLQNIPLFNTGSVTAMSAMFGNCVSLQSVPAINTSSVSSPLNTPQFANLPSLSRIEATGIRFTFSVANCKLSAAALDEIYTNLPTVTGQTITVTGNWGTAGDNTSIATAKGWTVTG